jgi:hypothetical protein
MLAFRVADGLHGTEPAGAPPTIPLIKGLVTVKLRQSATSTTANATKNPTDPSQPWLLVVLVVVLVNAWALATAVLVAKA